jgi:hypothetical protein
MKRIAICIDDYGLHEAIDDAILELAGKGRVSGTSCIVGGPGWQRDAARLKSACEVRLLDAGLHFDLTEHPLDPAIRRPLGSWMRAALLRNVDTARVRAEFRAQLDCFERFMGRGPSHVDGHQHVHQFALVRDVVIEELESRYAPGERPWIRTTRGAGRWRLKGRVIEAMGAAALEHACESVGFSHNRTLLGVYDFRDGPSRYGALLTAWLGDARDGDLLMAHVARSLVPGDEIARSRVVEWEVFSQDRFDTIVRDAGATVARMSDILNAQGT